MPSRKQQSEIDPSSELILARSALGWYIRTARLEAGLSLRDVERISGVNNSEIYMIEAGRQDARLDSFNRISSALGLPPGWAIDDTLWSKASFYMSALLKDPEFLALAAEMGGAELGPTEGLAAVLGNCCALAAQLARACAPRRFAARIRYPSEKVQDAFNAFAEQMDGTQTFAARAAILAGLRHRPLAELKAHGLFLQSLLDRFHEQWLKNPARGKPLREVLRDRVAGRSAGAEIWTPLPTVGQTGSAMLEAEAEMEAWFQNSPTRPRWTEEEKSLTNVSGLADSAPVQSTMRKLLERLNRATEPRGKKAQLARKLGVPRQCVSDWLSGKREPGGETTLRLLNWVEQEERKPK
ncbi:MAG: helix-turn-helix transcriptional regulator [Verrucomicrobia bacterium]|nr:helix-turn-helix transcriptional regulator [Verrucomicrobiota bacterium]